MQRPALLAFVAAAALSGCRDPASYPTLAPRPIEEVSFAEPAAPAPPPSTPAAQADARFAPLLAPIRDGDAAFARALDEAGPTLRAGRNAAVGSDAWAAAQQRLSRLQALRDPVAAGVSALRDAVDTPAVQADPGLAEAAARAMAAARAIDDAEAAALTAAAPARS